MAKKYTIHSVKKRTDGTLTFTASKGTRRWLGKGMLCLCGRLFLYDVHAEGASKQSPWLVKGYIEDALKEILK